MSFRPGFLRVDPKRDPRPGLIAISEMLVLICILASLLWIGTQVMAAVTGDKLSAAGGTKGSNEHCVYRISLDQQGSRLWVYRPRESLTQVNLVTNEMEQSLPFSNGSQLVVAHSRDGLTTMICDMEGNATLHRIGEETLVNRIKPGNDMIVDACINHDIALCLSLYGQISGWKRGPGGVQPIRFDLPGGAPAIRLHISHAGCRLTVARLDGTVSFHDPVTGTIVEPEWNVGNECHTFAWSEDERLMAWTTAPGRLQVMQMADRRIIFDGDTGANSSVRPTSLVISPDSRLIALSLNIQKNVQLWNVESGEMIGNLNGHEGIVRSLQFSPNAERLYTGSYDGTVREWSLASKSVVRVVE